MLKINSVTTEEKDAFYDQFSVKELEIKLLEEKSFQNRNIIRKAIRKKKKNVKEEDNQAKVNQNKNTQDIENLKKLLDKTTDYFEQCKIRSQILHIQKSENKSNFDQKTESPNKSHPNLDKPNKECSIIKNPEHVTKQLIFDQISTTSIDRTVFKISDNMKLIWIMPYKILSSIDYLWEYNGKNVNLSRMERITLNFDGRQASLVLLNVKISDSGVYKVTIHSQRLKKKSVTFRIIINEKNAEEPSLVIHEEEPKETHSEKKANQEPASEKSIIGEPKLGLSKVRFNRHKTMIGDELGGNSKFARNKENNIFQKEVKEIDSPPKESVLRRFNRSATSAKDIILTFCKLNTDEYYKYGVCVENLSTSWTDGLAFCALIHHFFPEAFDFSKLKKSDRRLNFELAFSTADKYAEIYPLLDIDDMMVMEKPDWKCIFTYVQCFYKAFRTHPNNRLKTVPIS